MTSIVDEKSEGSIHPEKRYGFKACLKRVYITFLVTFIPLLGLASTVAPDSEAKANLIFGFTIISSLCALVSAAYPTNRKMVYIPLSYGLLMALGVLGSILASVLK